MDLQPADFITLVSCLTTGSLAHDDDRDDDNGGKSDDNSDEVMAVMTMTMTMLIAWSTVAKLGIVKMKMVKVVMTVMTNCNNTNNIADSDDDNGDNGDSGDIYIMMKCLSVCLSRKIITSSWESPVTT